MPAPVLMSSFGSIARGLSFQSNVFVSVAPQPSKEDERQAGCLVFAVALASAGIALGPSVGGCAVHALVEAVRDCSVPYDMVAKVRSAPSFGVLGGMRERRFLPENGVVFPRCFVVDYSSFMKAMIR